MIDSIFLEPKIRTWVQNKEFSHAVYLSIALIINILAVYFWTVIALNTNYFIGIFSILISVINGFVAYTFMHYAIKYRLIFYSIVFSLTSLFLVKYFYYMHFYNWMISAVINKENIGFGLIKSYFKLIGGPNLAQAIGFYKSNFNIMEALYLTIAIISPFQYILFKEEEDENQEPDNVINNNDLQPKRMIKRRFDF